MPIIQRKLNQHFAAEEMLLALVGSSFVQVHIAEEAEYEDNEKQNGTKHYEMKKGTRCVQLDRI